MRDIFLYKADPVRGAEWARLFAQHAPQLDFRIWPAGDAPFADPAEAARVRFLAAWQPPADLLALPNLELLFSVGAGVDQLDFSTLPAHIPLLRMVEPGIVGGMVEYVSLAVLALHRDWHAYPAQQRAQRWQAIRVLPAASRRVGVLGLGSLAQAALAQLRNFGFPCAGWSRTQQTLDGVECYAGAEALPAFLARCDILICLLPLTPATRGILNAELFAALPRGAALINTGRGGHLVQHDLLAALAEGQLSHAILDVCDPEPLPPAHPFWEHPQITLTPHIASMTQPETAVEVVLDNLRRHAEGRPLTGLVDRGKGY